LPQNLDHGPEKNDQADAREQSPFGALQQRMRKLNDLVEDLFVPGQFAAQLRLQHLFETESLGDAEGHGGHRNDGDQGVKGDCRCPELTFVFIESADRKDQHPQ